LKYSNNETTAEDTGSEMREVPREVAMQLNPLIGLFGSADTMDVAADLLQGLGYAVSTHETEHSTFELTPHVFHLTNVVASALRYEARLAKARNRRIPSRE
jgi:hypothetical protein